LEELYCPVPFADLCSLTAFIANKMTPEMKRAVAEGLAHESVKNWITFTGITPIIAERLTPGGILA